MWLLQYLNKWGFSDHHIITKHCFHSVKGQQENTLWKEEEAKEQQASVARKRQKQDRSTQLRKTTQQTEKEATSSNTSQHPESTIPFNDEPCAQCS